MFLSAELFKIFHLAALVLFSGLTLALLLTTILNRLRLRRVVMAWRCGALDGFPLLPFTFLMIVLSYVTYSLAVNHPMNELFVIGYVLSGSCWLASSIMSNAVIITEYSVMKNLSRPAAAVAWGQIGDYFMAPLKQGMRYVFLYDDATGLRKRLELHVPEYCRLRFQRMVSDKLDFRFNFRVEQSYGKKAIND